MLSSIIDFIGNKPLFKSKPLQTIKIGVISFDFAITYYITIYYLLNISYFR